jgi:alanyl-tRNA synthetase
MDVDEEGFKKSMDEHRVASGAGKAMGALGGEDVEVFREVVKELEEKGSLPLSGVAYDPYTRLSVKGNLLAIISDGEPVELAAVGQRVEVILPETCFYIESGGQVSDTGIIHAADSSWEIAVEEMRKPAAGMIVHSGKVVKGTPKVGDPAVAEVDASRRHDIMRNHTATHLLHAELRKELGEHARQAGSLVAPDRLRFDFTHHEAVTAEQLARIEAGVNRRILGNYALNITLKPLQEAIGEGAMALFGEKYGETVRTIQIGGAQPFSYELCGGTHVDETGDIGICLITAEGSVAAGIRRIEAVTGRGAYELVQRRFQVVHKAAALLGSNPEALAEKAEALLDDLNSSRKLVASLQESLVATEFDGALKKTVEKDGVHILAASLTDATADTLRLMVDRFRQLHRRMRWWCWAAPRRAARADRGDGGFDRAALRASWSKRQPRLGGRRGRQPGAGRRQGCGKMRALAGVVEWVTSH